ncbi:hypothetical protein IQ235_07850 [Oscillatoriales cyanobacterium LEGE 11467]|uniref:Uncharacterized protein n=1 Tax=Zarconia navalis LEGE 11467 TaxID=1828826 RepID=A0A928Z9E5_9CYAN|nr:hypothetical protein [Zarconia navalis]MBE9040691.1 hypothetical protein [Zarconia navalis LEGE 11467]
MTTLPQSTLRRLQQLPPMPCVWEGDRRPVAARDDMGVPATGTHGECILWVDGSQGIVRAVDMVSEETGLEAIVRVLLRAMEHPHNRAQPGRPQKIVVRDREVLFFLRGVLQDLDIALEYVPDLPLIDEIFRGFQEVAGVRPPQLPPQYSQLLDRSAGEIWQDAPWHFLSDHQIIGIELNRWDIETLYASVLGMLGLDYGILFYRSVDSLKKFRASVMERDSMEQLEAAFLSQDCLFLTYESLEEEFNEDSHGDLADLPWSDIEPTFGNLHPLEGLRSFLYDDEAMAIWVTLKALHRFFRSYHRKLNGDTFESCQGTYKIDLPPEIPSSPSSMQVSVSTLPDLAAELFDIVRDGENREDRFEEFALPLLDEDLVPPKALLGLEVMPWTQIESFRHTIGLQVEMEIPQTGRGLPVLTVQTTRPKAKRLIEEIVAAGGLRGLCFNPGENPLEDEFYDLGILQTHDEQLHLFGEFDREDNGYLRSRQQWEVALEKAQGYCGVIVAMGATGASRGNPQPKDMMALFTLRSITPEELGLGPLQLMPMLSY